MNLELGNHWKGQFFTPYCVSSLMARMTMGDVKEQIQRQGFITVCEPACGAGGMTIAAAEAVMEQGVNFQKAMHVTAIDIDATAVHMTYVQLSLLHIPAIVIHGNSLALTEWAHWVTPAHALGGWDMRLRARSSATRTEAFAVPLIEVDQAAEIEAAEEQGEGAPLPALEQIRATVVEQRGAQLGLF